MKILTIILALIIPQMAVARMGETIEQCDKRYGVPTEKTLDDQSRIYLKKGIWIECFFESMPEGKCVHIKYSPVKSIKLAKSLWKSNHPSWRAVPGDNQNGFYRAESVHVEGYDDMLVWYVEGGSLRIDSLAYHDSNPNPDDPDARKKILAEAIDAKDLECRGQDGEKLSYAPKSQTPYTGWKSGTVDGGRDLYLSQYKDGKIHGLNVTYSEDGKKRSEANYKDGKERGLFTSWYENGQKESETNMKNGKEHGLVTGWYENGKKEIEAHYKDGKTHGLYTVWYENGRKRSETNMKNGKEHGLVTEWDENGKKRYETNFKDGKIVE